MNYDENPYSRAAELRKELRELDSMTIEANETTLAGPAEELRRRASSLFEEVMETICGPRLDTYGPPQESFQQIAEFWEAYLKRRQPGPLQGRDVANMMQLMKISRNAVHRTRDNTVDQIGYAVIEGVL